LLRGQHGDGEYTECGYSRQALNITLSNIRP
jgi:hypothetical protein